MTGLQLLPLGVGDAFSAERYSTCLALGVGGRWLLVDCPHPIRKMMREASARGGVVLDVDRVEAVALTHLHADHASGLEGFGFFSHFVLGRRARVAAHPGVARRLWDGHLAAGMEQLVDGECGPVPGRFEDFFELIPLDEAGAVRVGPFDIECRVTRHHIPTTAFRVTAAGRRLACSADTEFDPDLIAWLAEADLIIHEAGYGVHTPIERLAELPGDVRARMRLAHVPDQLHLAACGIEPLEQGRVYEL